MHELTLGYINNHTVDRLSQHPKRTGFRLQGQAASKLIEEITNRAGGAFLCVFHAIREMHLMMDISPQAGRPEVLNAPSISGMNF